MQKVRSHPCGLLLFVCMRFQILFHSPPGVLFTFPSRYWFTIGHYLVFSLAQWSARLPTKFHVLRRTLDSTRCILCFQLPDCHRLWSAFQTVRLTKRLTCCGPKPRIATVWAPPLSLAATWRIDSLSFPLAT